MVSVQVGAALAKNLFDTLGAPGVVWLRLGIAALVLVVGLAPLAVAVRAAMEPRHRLARRSRSVWSSPR